MKEYFVYLSLPEITRTNTVVLVFAVEQAISEIKSEIDFTLLSKGFMGALTVEATPEAAAQLRAHPLVRSLQEAFPITLR